VPGHCHAEALSQDVSGDIPNPDGRALLSHFLVGGWSMRNKLVVHDTLPFDLYFKHHIPLTAVYPELCSFLRRWRLSVLGIVQEAPSFVNCEEQCFGKVRIIACCVDDLTLKRFRLFLQSPFLVRRVG
jgi:hypothetical protein